MKKIYCALLCALSSRALASEMLIDEPSYLEKQAALLQSLSSKVYEMDQKVTTPDHAREVFEGIAPTKADLETLSMAFMWGNQSGNRFIANALKTRLDSIKDKGIAELDTWTFNLYNMLPFYEHMESSIQEGYQAELMQYSEMVNALAAHPHPLSTEQNKKFLAIQARLALIRRALGYDL